ncbi:CLUMA_CG006633, isoform A [Clunio marinus]|uniref:CLUMA_CG006633, isoform A n=1 Tax=Clunio marinus TaxID=568069 RepID=A0A1J1I0M4_9DIPT|nr:CLUMA_CG006633, isoform A [Clunio marinus]
MLMKMSKVNPKVTLQKYSIIAMVSKPRIFFCNLYENVIKDFFLIILKRLLQCEVSLLDKLIIVWFLRVKFIGVTLKICMNSHVLRWHRDFSASDHRC